MPFICKELGYAFQPRSCSSSTGYTLVSFESKRVAKLEYLRCYFSDVTYRTDFSLGVHKFYSNFNIMFLSVKII